MLNLNTHALIGGTTGAGKSTLLHSLVLDRLERGDAVAVIDLKKVEMIAFKPLALLYADEIDQPADVLRLINQLMDARYTEMLNHGERQSKRQLVWLVVDELADLMSLCDKGSRSALVRLGRLGRAANVRLLLATQSPSRKSLPAELVQNIPTRIALRCLSAIESRQILGEKGAEMLPKVGKGLYISPDVLRLTEFEFEALDEGAEQKRIENLKKLNIII